MNKKIIGILSAIIIILGGGGYAILGGGGQSTISQVRAGSASQFTAMPSAYVEARTTTTDALTWDSSTAGTLQQELLVDGITRISIAVQAEGGTATSTLSVKPQISYDGTTFFDVYSSTTPAMNGISTLPSSAKVDRFTPGITTSSKAWIMEIPTAEYLRLLWLGDDLTTDPLDGVKAFIQVALEQGN